MYTVCMWFTFEFPYKYPHMRKNARACRARIFLKALSIATSMLTSLKITPCFCKYLFTQPKAPLSSGVQSKQ